MFNIGGSELVVILFVALIFLGPERLPTAAKQVGKTIATLRGMAQGFQREFEDAISTAEDSAREEQARAKGAELVAASTTSSADADTAEPDANETRDGAGDRDGVADADDGAAPPAGGFDPTAEPDRTEKPVSAGGPMFHSAGPDVGPKIARRTPADDGVSAEPPTSATESAAAADGPATTAATAAAVSADASGADIDKSDV